MAQDAVNRFWWPALMMFGPSDEHSPNSAQSIAWKIKRFSNDELRQKFVDNTVPQVLQLGLEVPDPDLKFNEETGHYEFGEIDWHEFNEVIADVDHVITSVSKHAVKHGENGKWVRDAAVVYAKKQQLESEQSGLTRFMEKFEKSKWKIKTTGRSTKYLYVVNKA